jgi:Fuc2NAc and GlcNAc transferase
MSQITLVATSILLSFFLTGLATWYARRSGMVDHPGDRHSHTVATPRGGGAGLILALIFASLFLPGSGGEFWSKCILPGVVVLAILGWRDDHAALSARFRILVQLAASIYLISCAHENGWMTGAGEPFLAVLALVWMSNLYNFMDGSNGMAGLQGVFGGVVLYWLFASAGDFDLASVSALVAACCVGFLPWNFGKARVFMGDVGSVSLGFVFGALLVSGVGLNAFSLPVALLVMLVFLTDSTLTLLVRVMKGERWYNAHRKHMYQRLIAHGWTHNRVALVYQVINLAMVVPGIVVAIKYPGLAWPVVMAMILIFAVGWFLVTRRLEGPARAG